MDGFIASVQNELIHDILKQALEACNCMEHRGATSTDNISGDGADVMTAIPIKLFSYFGDEVDVKNSDDPSGFAVGMVFLP